MEKQEKNENYFKYSLDFKCLYLYNAKHKLISSAYMSTDDVRKLQEFIKTLDFADK